MYIYKLHRYIIPVLLNFFILIPSPSFALTTQNNSSKTRYLVLVRVHRSEYS